MVETIAEGGLLKKSAKVKVAGQAKGMRTVFAGAGNIRHKVKRRPFLHLKPASGGKRENLGKLRW